MPDDRKRELVELLARHDIPLIEDDVYGDLAFGPSRPVAVKAYDEKGLVLYCSSFSKTLAPGYRVGWIAPGRYQRKVQQLKSLFNIATATPTQLAIAEFLTNGGYDHHLRTIRRVYSRQMEKVRDAVARHFPPGTRVTRPEGGFVLWVEMPEGSTPRGSTRRRRRRESASPRAPSSRRPDGTATASGSTPPSGRSASSRRWRPWGRWREGWHQRNIPGPPPSFRPRHLYLAGGALTVAATAAAATARSAAIRNAAA